MLGDCAVLTVRKLRQKIETDPANARLLLTEAGGYKLAP